MGSAEREVVIERPVEDVYAFLANPENDLQWRTSVADISHSSGEGVGAVYKQGVKGPTGRRLDADIEITELRPNELIAFRTLDGPVTPTGRYELSRDGDATRVRFALEAELRGPKKILMGAIVQKAMTNEVNALDNLKRVLERR
jgi:uncharacterized membrane protein